MKHNFSQQTHASHVDLFLEGELYYEAYVRLIDEAKITLHLQTYIFDMDRFGSEVHAALIRAAGRGVQVYLLIDSVGSQAFSWRAENELAAGGVHVHRFNGMTMKWLYQWGRRLHHKILFVDDLKAFVGGINVTRSGYGHPGIHPQLDFAVCLQGPVTIELGRYCEYVLRKSIGASFSLGRSLPKSPLLENTDSVVALKISINDWVYRRWQITRQYSRLTKRAQKEITIMNSYFFPRRNFMRQLTEAARRGVRVRLILPRSSDWPSYILASQYLYAYFLERGVEIYEWKKSILHGKMAIVDGAYATIGSFNLNYTSYQQNLEMNVDFHSEWFAQLLNKTVEELITMGCEKIETVAYQRVSRVTKMKRFIYYHALSFIANFSVVATYRRPRPSRSL